MSGPDQRGLLSLTGLHGKVHICVGFSPVPLRIHPGNHTFIARIICICEGPRRQQSPTQLVRWKDFNKGGIHSSGVRAQGTDRGCGHRDQRGRETSSGPKGEKKRRGSVEEKVAQRALCVACLGNAFVSLSHPLSPPAVSAAAVVSS